MKMTYELKYALDRMQAVGLRQCTSDEVGLLAQHIRDAVNLTSRIEAEEEWSRRVAAEGEGIAILRTADGLDVLVKELGRRSLFDERGYPRRQVDRQELRPDTCERLSDDLENAVNFNAHRVRTYVFSNYVHHKGSRIPLFVEQVQP
ncbi:MAG: hypothetical protein WC205_04200 [Opitutaceae bacterium]|jgi:hypothetical protein